MIDSTARVDRQDRRPERAEVEAEVESTASHGAANGQGERLGKRRGKSRDGSGRWDDSEPEVFEPWSKHRAQVWRQSHPPVSPRWVVAAQAVAGLVCCAVIWGITQRGEAAWSALYGAAAAVVPGALLARGMSKSFENVRGAAGVAVLRFMFWEMVKIGVAIAMLVVAPRVIQGLNWPALLVTMIVCMKVNWLALLWQRRPVVSPTTRKV